MELLLLLLLLLYYILFNEYDLDRDFYLIDEINYDFLLILSNKTLKISILTS